MSKPSKQEILEKYRHLIDSDDFEILETQSVPNPQQMRLERAKLEYLGPLNGAFIWVKRVCGHVVAVIICIGGFVQGVEYINRYTQIACAKVADIIQTSDDSPSEPATEYRITLPPEYAWIPNESFPFNPPSGSTTSTTTTTTAAPDSTRINSLSPGSGLLPFSQKWERLT